ncbi:MAG: O-antigen ligase family protein [Planctomycetota bacterium]
MSRIQLYFSVLPWWMWLIALFACLAFLICFFALTPRNARISVALAVMIVWIELGRWISLGLVQAFAKTTYILPVIFVGCLALISNSPKRRTSPLVLMIPIAGIIALIWIIPRSTQIDLILHLMQIVTCFSAIFVAKLCWSEEQTRRILMGLIIGYTITLLIPFSQLLINPGSAFAIGLNRFAPFKSNPNQIGPIFIISCVFGVYLFLASEKPKMRFWGIGLLAASVSMGLLTGSRTVVYIQAMILIPAAFKIIKRPVLAVTGVFLIVVLVVVLIIQSAQSVQQTRLTNLQTARFELQYNYLKNIMKNPLIGFGTMTAGEASDEWVYGSHAHNSYLQSATFAGIPYTLILMTPSAIALFAGLRLWQIRRIYPDLSNRYFFASVLLLGLLLVGLTTSLLYYPTFSASFMHTWLVAWLISSWQSNRRNEPIELSNHTY